jgi:hypothetical protein
VVALSVWFFTARNDTATRATQFFSQMLQYGPPIWGSQFGSKGISSRQNCSAELGANQTCAADLDRQLDVAKSWYLDEVYPKQLYLDSLATHLDWDGYGFAVSNSY